MKNVVMLFHDLSTPKLKAYFKLEYKQLDAKPQHFASTEKNMFD